MWVADKAFIEKRIMEQYEYLRLLKVRMDCKEISYVRFDVLAISARSILNGLLNQLKRLNEK